MTATAISPSSHSAEYKEKLHVCYFRTQAVCELGRLQMNGFNDMARVYVLTKFIAATPFIQMAHRGRPSETMRAQVGARVEAAHALGSLAAYHIWVRRRDQS